VRWRIGPIPTTLLEMLIIITVAMYAATLWRHRGPLPSRTWLDIPIALLLIAGAIAIFVASDHRGALGIYRAYLLEPIAIYYVAVAVLGTAAAIESVLLVWAVGAVLFSGIEIATFAAALLADRLNPDFAAAAFGINPNSVALYLEPLIGLAAGFALFGERRQRVIAAACLLFLLPAELATLSRGGLLALATLVGIAIVTVQAPRLRIGLMVGAAAGVVGALTLPIIGPRVARGFDPMWGTFENRGRIWAATFRMLRDHPLFGAGLNSYQATMAPYRLADRNLIPEPYPHNIFLTSWTELGVLGMVAFSAVLVGLVVVPWRRFKHAVAGLQRALLWGTGAAFAMMLVHGLVDSPYWKNDLSLEFWSLAALQAVSLKIVYNTSHPR
jgi:O-antigen ligase